MTHLLGVGMTCEWGTATGVEAFAAALRHGRQVAGVLSSRAGPSPAARLTDTLVRVGVSALQAAALPRHARVALAVLAETDPVFEAPPARVTVEALRATIVRSGTMAGDHSGAAPSSLVTSVIEALSCASIWLVDEDVDAVIIASASLFTDPCAAAALPSIRFSMAFDIEAAAPPAAEGAVALVVMRAGAAMAGARPHARIRPEAGHPPALALLLGTPERAMAEEAMLGRLPRDRKCPVALGCVRATVGDAGVAADLGAIVAAMVCIRYRMQPAVPHWTGPRSSDLHDHAALFVPTETRYWPRSADTFERGVRVVLPQAQRHGGVTAVDVEDLGPAVPASRSVFVDGGPLLFPLVAESSGELTQGLSTLLRRAASTESLTALSHASVRDAAARSDRPLACALVSQSVMDLEGDGRFLLGAMDRACATSTTLRTPGGSIFTPCPLGQTGRMAFVYPGVGSGYVGLGRELLLSAPSIVESIIERAGIEHLLEWLAGDHLYPRSPRRLDANTLQQLDQRLATDTANLAAVSAAFSVLHTTLLLELVGLRPSMALGFSLGELYMRAALGQWPHSTSLLARTLTPVIVNGLGGALTAVRRYWQVPEVSSGPEGMAPEPLWHSYVVKASPVQVAAACARERRVYLTAIHAPDEVMIGGDPIACARVIACTAAVHGGAIVRLPFAIAAHSPPALVERTRLAALGDHPLTVVPGIDFYSAAAEGPVPQDRAAVANSIAVMATRRLDFPRLVRRVYDDGARVFVETGVRNNCTHWIKAILADRPHVAVAVDVKGVPSNVAWLRALATLFVHRVPMDVSRLIADAPPAPSACVPSLSVAEDYVAP